MARSRTRISRALTRLVTNPLEALAVLTLVGLFRSLPLTWASAVGGRLARLLGPLTGAHRTARHNLTRAFPECNDRWIGSTLDGMWNNLGRGVGENAHLGRRKVRDEPKWVEIVGGEHLDTLRDAGQRCVFVTAHLGNWELAPLVVAAYGIPLTIIYRHASNPLVDAIILRLRRHPLNSFAPKGGQGARAAMQSLTAGRSLGMLTDQKMNDGLAVPFFGRDAMTASAMAQLTLRYDCPVVAVQVERLGGVRARVTIHPPRRFDQTEDHQADMMTVLTWMNQSFENWIQARPAQWLWVHHRWPD